jgi:alkylation response protein AidB-like acyl-CoA dehydrogenase
MQVAAGAMATGVMRGSFDEALAYTRQRRQGGREIVNWSEVRMLLAGVGLKLRTAELSLTEACRQAEEEEPGWEASAAAATLYAQEAAVAATTDGIQLLGGNGYMKEYHQEKRFRDAQQIQALLGLAPLKRIKFIGRIIDGEPF